MPILIEHQGQRPEIDPTATIAPTAVLSGAVYVGPHCSVGFGAVLTAEGGPVHLEAHCIVMEQALIRGTARHPTRVGKHVLVGPRASLSGCTVQDYCFIATGATLFNGAVAGTGSEVRINGVVHVNSVLPPESTVPIGWVAVGDPAEILPPDQHERIWAVQEPLNFPRTVFGLERGSTAEVMTALTTRYARAWARHQEDRVLATDD